MAGKGGNTFHPHTFQFPRSIQQVTGTVYETVSSAFVKREEKQKQRKRSKNSL